jgi:putative ABC transport system permease protein
LKKRRILLRKRVILAEIKPRRLRPRWRKVLADLWGNKVRTILVTLSIAVGVFAVGYVSVTFIILLTDMDRDYQSVNPHAAIIYSTSLDEELIDALENVPGVAQTEGRSVINGRITIAPGKKITLGIAAIPKITEMKIDRLRMEDGSAPPVLQEQEVFVERSDLQAMPIKKGDHLHVELSDGRFRDLRVAGIVHDVSTSPYIFTNRMIAYVNLDTMEWLDGTRTYNQVFVTVSENKTDRPHVEFVARAVADKIEKSGHEVSSTYIFQPGRHYASDFMLALGFLLGFFGLLAVLLSAFLVINTIISLLAQHIPQIGIMKLVGGSTPQIIGVYLTLVTCFGVLAFLIAAPTSLPLGYLTAKVISGFFNFDVGAFRIPLPALLLQLGISLLIPLLTALLPILSGAGITITEAINSRGLGSSGLGHGLIDRWIEKVRSLPRPLLISLRNTIRRKGRLALTLSTLTMAGGIFIAVFNLWSVIDLMMEHTFGYFLADVTVTLTRPFRIEQIAPLIHSNPQVGAVEGWGTASAQLLSRDKQSVLEIMILAPPPGSKLIEPVLTSGRWLEKEDQNAMVIGNHLIKERPDLKVGDEMIVEIEGREYPWRIVGIYELAGMMAAPMVYVNNTYLAQIVHEADRTTSFRVMTIHHDANIENSVIKTIDETFDRQGIPISQISSRTQIFGGMVASMDAIVYALLMMALLIAVVGGLGLTGMMSMNVLERTREIGVMRSIGASDKSILQLVVVEGMLIGAASWLLGIVLAFPLTIILAYAFGMALVSSPLDPAFSVQGYLIWLCIVLFIAAVASAVPARSASRLTVREVLAYE